MRKLLFFSALAVASQVSGQVALDQADAVQEPPLNHCVVPVRPLNDQDDERWQSFLMQVDQFRDCVNRRVQWHQNAAVMHSDRARQTALLWNDFVQSSLNAPADFPHPGEKR